LFGGLRRRRESGDEVSDYYDLLGVEPGADKDTIKSAYRDQLDGATQAERAKLNKAWNVLSDPVQRERYDDARSEGWLDDAEGDDEETAPTPRSGGRAAPRERAARPAPVPTVELPDGMQLAEPRSRGLALLIDFSVLFVIYIVALSGVLPSLLKDQYPTQSHRIDAVNRNIDTLDTFKTHADDRANRKEPSADDRKQARTDKAKFDHDVTCLASSTALTGQTLGMRLRRVRVVRVDGSKVGWAGAFARFVVPLAIALLLPQLGAIIGLGLVLWFLRDKNRQGVHDKLARTLVVDA
jgi:uncharacterized RDD family membrane protein YckC